MPQCRGRDRSKAGVIVETQLVVVGPARVVEAAEALAWQQVRCPDRFAGEPPPTGQGAQVPVIIGRLDRLAPLRCGAGVGHHGFRASAKGSKTSSGTTGSR